MFCFTIHSIYDSFTYIYIGNAYKTISINYNDATFIFYSNEDALTRSFQGAKTGSAVYV